MFDKEQLAKVLDSYKKVFVSKWWGDERYKWEAVKWFQDNWDVNAADFPEMLNRSLEKTFNLLASANNFPRAMIVGLAKAAPEEVRALFISLYDESRDVYERIDAFKQQSSILLEKYGNGAAQHYQYENAITTYLWLRYPYKYYIYKFSEVKTVIEELHADYHFKKGAYADNIHSFLKLYDEINGVLKEDTELVNLLQSQLSDNCYQDPELKTLTIDVCFFISRSYSQKQTIRRDEDRDYDEMADSKVSSDEWYPSLEEYTPGFSKEDWLKLLNNKQIIGPVWGGVLAAFYAAGGSATCSQIAKKYKTTAPSISGKCTQLSKRIYNVTKCPLFVHEEGKKSYWPILFQGKSAGSDIEGKVIWRLRSELVEALTEFDILRYEWITDYEDSEDDDRHYWWLNANPKIWSFNNISVGEAQAYTLYNENGHKRRIFQNFLDAKVGDMIIGYESNPVKQIVAICRVIEEQDGEKILFEKVEALPSPIDYAFLKECPDLENMEYFQNPQGSLFKLTKGEYEFLMDIIRDDNPVSDADSAETYTKAQFLDEVFMSEERYDKLVGVLQNKKNIILQGAPGVGKTFTAKRLAWAMMGEIDDNRIEFVQFHQNYSYEDFMMGYKPSGEGFELKYGIFYRFCQKAANQPDKDYFFIIDEINRGNMSKIFGELLMLIEKDYRGTKVTLPYNGLSFSVPKNLYIIGMMNTADRSLAMIDYALRRRFSFFEIAPGFDSKGFIQYQKELNNETLDKVIMVVKELNHEIENDKSLGKGFCIGHSYFCGRDVCTEDWLRSIVEYDLIPMISEYWFDDPKNVQIWTNNLLSVFQ